MQLIPQTHDAAQRLDHWFALCPGAAVAFSGGVDSALVSYWARRRLGRYRATSWVADSPSLKRRDLEVAREFAAAHDIELRIMPTHELDNPEYARNPINRCYFCKSTLYDTLARSLHSFRGKVWICSGVNLDDKSDYRPSMKAAEEACIRHPLLECGIDKETVRALANAYGLSIWDKPASPCLSSRIPYGQSVTREKLHQIEAAEDWLQRRGFPVCRVRHFGDSARVEVPLTRQDELIALVEEMQTAFGTIGFSSAEIDAGGFESGKLNRAIGITPSRNAS